LKNILRENQQNDVDFYAVLRKIEIMVDFYAVLRKIEIMRARDNKNHA